MKSLITALWERSVSKKRVDPINPEADAEMRFAVGEPRRPEDGQFVLTENTSLVYLGEGEGDFSVYLAGNWRFELKVDSDSGACVDFSGFMSKLTARRTELNMPSAEKRTLICKSGRLAGEGVGCYSAYPSNAVLFDDKKRILCLGDHEAEGEAVEFLDRAVAVLGEGKLLALYINLDNIADDPKSESNLMNCIVLV